MNWLDKVGLELRSENLFEGVFKKCTNVQSWGTNCNSFLQVRKQMHRMRFYHKPQFEVSQAQIFQFLLKFWYLTEPHDLTQVFLKGLWLLNL